MTFRNLPNRVSQQNLTKKLPIRVRQQNPTNARSLAAAFRLLVGLFSEGHDPTVSREVCPSSIEGPWNPFWFPPMLGVGRGRRPREWQPYLLLSLPMVVE